VNRVAVIRFPGSCDDRDALRAVALCGASAIPVWHRQQRLDDVDAVILPGGFSYGDYLRCGAIASLAPVMAAVRRFAAEGGPVLGICNGFQVLCEAGLLPGVLRQNHHRFVCRDVDLVVERENAWTPGCGAGARLVIPVKHGEGAWYAPAATLDAMTQRGQVVLRYADDVNGACGRVAGVCNERGNVFGLMPHPEHAVDAALGSTDGRVILAGLVGHAAPTPIG
jgi:phosphoribosylformylglycinamidine synthase subunit PurQ / glutaminase